MTGLVFDEVYKNHDPGPGHPESPARYVALEQAFLSASFPASSVRRISGRLAGDDDLHLCHTRAYLKIVQHDLKRGAAMLSTGDTVLGKDADVTARSAVGGVLGAVDAVMLGEVKNAFVASRPPGHHATASRGMGFCLYNGVAIGARYARKRHGVDRVLIVDWDVHHGNGTQDIFYADPSVFFFSTHQAPWYPGTGASDETGSGAGKGRTMNCPFPAGAGRREVLGAIRKKLLPAALAFDPGLVLISAGFDSRQGDPLGRFRLHDEDFAEMTKMVMHLAGGRVVSVLEGGYDLEGLARASLAHLRALS